MGLKSTKSTNRRNKQVLESRPLRYVAPEDCLVFLGYAFPAAISDGVPLLAQAAADLPLMDTREAMVDERVVAYRAGLALPE